MQIKMGSSVMVTGTAGKDAEYKTVGDKGSSLCKFSLKVDEKPNEDPNERPTAIWANCDCWHALARYAQNIKKGDAVMATGKIEGREYNGKTYNTLVCDYVSIAKTVEAPLAPKNTAESPEEFYPIDESEEDGDLPF